MSKNEIVIIVDYAQETLLTLEELCGICGISPDFVKGLLEEDIITMQVGRQGECLFDLKALHRIQTLLRLQRDLDVNVAGAALVLDLMDEVEALRAEMRLMEKHYFR
jgi:chaperone modulatory protein CbpM